MTNFNREEEKQNELSTNNELKETILSHSDEEKEPIQSNLSENDEKVEITKTEAFESIGNEAQVNDSSQSEITGQKKVVREVQIIEDFEERTAGFWIRFWAFLIDTAVVAAITGILVNPIFLLFGWDLHATDWYAPITIISGVFYYSYFVLTTKIWQQTLGKMIFGLKVIPTAQEKLTWSTVLFRELVGRLICNIMKVLYILVAFTPQNKGVHDYFADTVVIQEKVYVKNKKEIVKETFTEDTVNPLI